MKLSVVLLLALSFMSVSIQAGRYHTDYLTEWQYELNNGVAYVTSAKMPAHCSHSRAQISMTETGFDKSQFAYILAAYAANKSIKVVVDDEDTVCVISGVRDYD